MSLPLAKRFMRTVNLTEKEIEAILEAISSELFDEHRISFADDTLDTAYKKLKKALKSELKIITDNP